MCRPILRLLFVVALTALAFVGDSRGGPNDSQPIGPLPHAIVHAPSTVSRTATAITVWVHAHNMSEMEPYLVAIRNGYSLDMSNTTLTVTQVGDGQWDCKFVCGTSGWNLQAGQTLSWLGEVINFDDGCVYTGTAESSITN